MGALLPAHERWSSESRLPYRQLGLHGGLTCLRFMQVTSIGRLTEAWVWLAYTHALRGKSMNKDQAAVILEVSPRPFAGEAKATYLDVHAHGTGWMTTHA